MGKRLLELYYKKFKKEWKIAFLSTIIIGLIAHIYKFTNYLPNHDRVYGFYGSENVIGSGRWLLSIACGLTSYFDLPWVNGIVSLFIIAITVVILIATFEIKNPILILLVSGITVTFPGITETFFFEFTADGYMFAMLFAAISVNLSMIGKNRWNHYVVPMVMVCCTCGIYQAYVSYALIFAICYFMLSILDGNFTRAEYIRWIIRQAAIYVIGLCMFFVLWKGLLFLQNTQINAYQGIDSMTLSVSNIIHGIKNSLTTSIRIFIEWNIIKHRVTLYAILNIVFLLLFIYGIICAIIKTKLINRMEELVLFGLCLVSIPFFVCIWSFISDEVGYRPMMLQSISLLFIYMAILYERYCTFKLKDMLAILLGIIIFNNIIIANICYFYMNRCYDNSVAVATELVSRIHLMDVDVSKIRVIGERTSEVNLIIAEEHAEKIPMMAQLLETDLFLDEIHLVRFMNELFFENYSIVSNGWENESGRNEFIQQMGIWPAKDSVQVLDNTIVIKMKEMDKKSKNERD